MNCGNGFGQIFPRIWNQSFIELKIQVPCFNVDLRLPAR